MTARKRKKVYKSNALVEASYKLTPAEQRLLWLCLVQASADAPLTDEREYSVRAADYAALAGVTHNSVYEEMSEAADRLHTRLLRVYEEPNGEGRLPRERHLNWVQASTHVRGEGRVAVQFTKHILPYLEGLTEQYTWYVLKDAGNLNSEYAIRLYELCCQRRDIGWREVPVEWLRGVLHLEDKYPSIKDFKQWVLEPAVRQINERTSFNVSWKQRKTGRKVTHLRFTFALKAPTRRVRPPGKGGGQGGGQKGVLGVSRELIEQHARPGESYEDAARRLKLEGH